MSKKEVSVYSIAEICGVSAGTVSRALNGKGRVADETRQQILSVARQYGYQTKAAAKPSGQTADIAEASRFVGVIASDITNEFFSGIIHDIEAFFFDHGYTTLICNADSNPRKEKAYVKALCEQHVSGIIFLSGYTPTSALYRQLQFPVAMINRGNSLNTPHIVYSNNYEGGRLAARELLQKGCRRILLLTRNYFSSVRDGRSVGFFDELASQGITEDPQLIANIFAERSTYSEAADAVLAKLHAGVRFDGIFATNDIRAIGALQALQSENISVPGDVRLVGFDGSPTSQATYPTITTVRQDTEKMAEYACRMLYAQIQGNTEDVPDHILVPVRLLKGEST